MIAENAGILLAEDALSTSYSTDSHTDSTAATPTSSSLATSASNTSSASSSSKQHRHDGGLFSFVKRLLGFGTAADMETVKEIRHCFRKDDVEGMRKFIDSDGDVSGHLQEEEFWWDEKDVLAPPPKTILKPTPHFKKLIPSHVRKAVRFDKDYTPEEKTPRAFAPLFTSTPINAVDENDESDDEDMPPLRNCDSNTVVAPRSLNNTSLLSKSPCMRTLNNSLRQTDEALRRATDISQAKSHYRVCYDDTDEEEVVEDEESTGEIIPPTPLRTFSINKEPNPSPKSPNVHELSLLEMEFNTSTDSSVVLGLDRIEDYIQCLEDEIAAANRFARDKDVLRGHGAIRHAQVLQERLSQMNEALNEMCGKFKHHEPCSGDDGALETDKKEVSAAFEDSCWAQRLNFEAGSFDAHQL